MAAARTTATLRPAGGAGRAYSEEELARFEQYRARQSAHHPLYSTETGMIGSAPPGVKVEVRPPEHGKGKGEALSKSHVGNFRFSGLDTTTTRHPYLKELDGKY